MAKTKQPYQAQIDKLCQTLNISDPQYTESTTITELEVIIDKLESQLPDQASGDDVAIYAVSEDDLPEGAVIEQTAGNVEINADDTGKLKVKALKTFVAIVDGQETMLIPDKTCFLPEEDAMHAVGAGVACLTGSLR